MNRDSIYDKPEQYHLPHVGQRITKTTVAVFLCLIIYYLRGYQGESMPTEAMITAIICMQPYVRDSRDYALNRLAGTLIGAGWGLLFCCCCWFSRPWEAICPCSTPGWRLAC